MKTLKYFSLVFLMLFSVRVMAQNEIKMHTGSVNIGEGKTYYFFDSGGEEEMTVAEDPENNYRWKTWYSHNEAYTLTFKVPENSTKGIKVTFSSLLINDDSLIIYEGAPGDSNDLSKRIVALTTTNYSTAYSTFSVMSHGNMNIRFRSNSQYRDAGWIASVKLEDFAPQKPIALKEACANIVHILPTSIGEIRYTIDGEEPTASSTLYNDNNPIVISATTTVRAITVENSVNSTEFSDVFDTETTKPTTPTITRIGNNKIELKANKPNNLNDTWYVRYTTNSDDPTGNTATEAQDEATIELTQPCTLRVVTRPTVCSTHFSDEDTAIINVIYVPAPEITITDNDGNNGAATITSSFSGATIYYTISGVEPTTDSASGNSPINLTNLVAGTTIKAMAVVNGTGYEHSSIASKTYIPGGEGNSGTFGSIVLIDDREDHSWSYYSDKDNPIRSLNPADVKITYFGNGTNNISTTNGATPANDSWTQSATGVQVSYNETENQFIYLKTLERTDGTTATSVENAKGRCEYTTIPNPFSKRPTYGSGDTRWRGFYGWRIKSIRGGKIYSAATGGMEYTAYTSGNLATTNMLNAETTYYFAPDNETGMEVELEALWARAYVTTGTSNMNTTANSYERNFHVITSNNTTASNLQKSYPLTISSRYPNGDNGGGSLSGAFSAAADTKFENIAVSSATTSSWSGNGHNFIVGRGVSGTISKIYGLTNGTGSSSDNYNFIVESGTYGDIYLARQNGTFTGKVTSILGSDYDRAKNTNTLLKVNNNVYLGYGATIGSSSNIGAEAMYCTVKSGNYDFGTYGVDNQFYISSPNGSVFAKRTLIIEGGLFSDIAGGIEANSSIQNIGDHEMINMRFKGGTIKGAVFGAAQYSGSGGHRRFVITGGDFAGWIAGGCNGTKTDGGELFGNTEIYFGGKSQCNSNGSTTTMGSGKATGGNIFGAGSGNSGASGDNATVGRVNSSTIVIADEAIVERDVYGGGNYGYVRDGENNKSDIYVLGGEVKGSVFGGSNMQKGQNVNITMNNGVVGNVYGGSNTQGTINYNVAVNITGGQVKGNVHGGGYGQNTNVAGNVEVTIGGTNPQDTPTIAGDVYGGGALGKVNTTAASNTTHVTVNAGTMNNVYGGGLGQGQNSAEYYTIYLNWSAYNSNYSVTYTYVNESGITMEPETKTSSSNTTIKVKANSTITLTAARYCSITARYDNATGTQIAQAASNNSSSTATATIDGTGAGSGNSIAANVGTVTVDIKGGNMINVFGCNNLNGAPQGSVTVNFDGGEAVNVYGGGNLADYLPNTTLFPTVNITGGKVTNSVYGGGAFAKVNKTIVNMTGGEAGNVYAGAQGDNKNKKLVNYNKTVNMQGGTAIMVYGGSFTCLDSAKSFVNISGGRVKTHVFGSGYFGDMKGDCYVYIGKNAITSAPHSGENGDKFTTTLSDEKPIWIESNVYAGANWGSFQGTFGEATITGASNIYIDGEGYDMAHGKSGNYMIIGGSVFGSGTSCAAGTTDHSVIVRNYGNMTYPSMTRSLKSIQRASKLIFDNSNIDFTGQGDISSMDPTVEYGIINIDTVYAANNSNMALSKPLDMVHKLGSYTCADVYASTPAFTTNNYDKPHAENNGIVINNGGYLMVHYYDSVQTRYEYGELQGYFNMREPGDDAGINNEGYIFARPKIIKDNGESAVEKANTQFNVFTADGGFIDFDANASDTARNTFDANGNKVRNRKRVEGPAIQMPYTNRVDGTTLADRSTEADNNTEYRFWRFEPDTVPVVTREVVFVVKADEEASSTSNKFLTTTGSVLLPPALGDNNKYYITGLTWGADGKDCNPANITKTGNDNQWRYFDDDEFKNTTDSNITNSIEEYFANPNSTFGFLMQFDGNLKAQDPKILDNNSFDNYFKANSLAEVDGTNTTELPELDFLVTYSDRLSQNEMWAEARMTIEERDANGNVVQKIYLNISVTTITKFGQDVETYVYASTKGDRVAPYIAQLNLPTFALADNTKFYATFKAADASKSEDFGQVGSTTIGLVNYGEQNVQGTKNLALQFTAVENDDNTDGWYHKGNAQNPNQGVDFDFNKVLNGNTPNDSVVGASDGRKYTTIAFELQYDPRELAKVDEFKLGQKYLGDLTIQMLVNNIEGGINTFNIIVHVYVTGPTKFFYLDGVAGKDGNSGMFPDKAKKTLNGVLNASGYTVEDPVFVVNGVKPKDNGTLTWNADKFLNSVTVPEEDKENYTEEQLRQLSQVKVYRYPGGHPKENGETNSTNDFYNGMFKGQIINVPEGTQFTMHNVCLSGGSDLDNLDTNDSKYTYNPDKVTMKSGYPLISIAKGTTVSIDNSSLVYNNDTSTTAIAGAIYNEGDLTIDGVSINNNISVAENGRGAGVYFKDGSMKLGNTAAIIIADQVYLYDHKIMEAPHGELYKGSYLSNILVYHDAHPNPIDVKYSGRVIVRYTGTEPSAPKAPFWKTLVNGVPQNQSSILKNHKAAEDSYESDKYGLNTTEMIGFEKANGGDENVLPYITDEMKAETYAPITSNDIIVYSTKANLPVELLYFTAECMGEATLLQWSTASETNNEYFTIERSSDAVNYEEVARIQGAGTTSQRNDYSFMVDNNSTAITYYRLRQTDIDGKYEIFTPIAIQCQNNKAATEISIYPVPANDQVNIFSSNSPMTRIEIYSIMGAKVAEEPAEGNQTTLHIGNLATGVYAVKVFTEDGQVSNVRLIKK